MSKNFIFKLLIGLVILAGPVLWLLSLTVPETFGWFNLSYAVAIVSGGVGALLILFGVFKKGSTTYKKANIYLGVGLLVVTVVALAMAIALPKNIIAPIVCVVVAAGLVVSIIATGGKSWDEADNNKVGYKNYHQRKAEEDKKNEQK